MNKRTSIKDIAGHTKVARSTVSRVLNNVESAYPIASATREEIFAAARTLNYTPNINARRLFRNKSYTIALVIPSLDDRRESYALSDELSFWETMQGIEDALYLSTYRLTLIFRNRRYLEQKEYLRLFDERTIDGMLIWGTMSCDNYLQELAGKPVVQLNSHAKPTVDAAVVEINHRQGGFQVGSALLQAGCRRILYISGTEGISITDEYRYGFFDALLAFGVPIRNELFFSGGSDSDGLDKILDQVLTDGVEFDAICCFNDDLARQCRVKLNEKAPGLAAGIKFGGGGRSSRQREYEDHIEISSYLCPYYNMGKQGTELLLSAIKNGVVEKSVSLPTTAIMFPTNKEKRS